MICKEDNNNRPAIAFLLFNNNNYYKNITFIQGRSIGVQYNEHSKLFYVGSMMKRRTLMH